MKYNSENLELLTESAWGKELLLRVLLLFLAAAYSYWKIIPCPSGRAAILKLFRRFLKALHFAGYMKEYEGGPPALLPESWPAPENAEERKNAGGMKKQLQSF